MKTLKPVFALLIIFSFSQLLNAQPVAGVKAGLNICSISGYDGRGRTSFHIGTFARMNINSSLKIQGELLYSGEGQHYIPIEEPERTIALNFVKLPVMVQVYPCSSFFLETGPQFAVLATAMDKGAGGEKIKVTRSFRNTELSWGIGFGFQGKNKLGFSGRFNFGLTDLTLDNGFLDHSRAAQFGITVQL